MFIHINWCTKETNEKAKYRLTFGKKGWLDSLGMRVVYEISATLVETLMQKDWYHPGHTCVMVDVEFVKAEVMLLQMDLCSEVYL